MKSLHSFILSVMLLAAALAPQPVRAEGAALMVLEYVENDKVVQTEIRPKPGVFLFPPPTRPAARWRIAPGTDHEGEKAPPGRSVEFLRKSGETVEPLCLVHVRYFRHGEGWRPAYRLDETPLFARDASGRWRPLTLPSGDPTLLHRLGAALPNAEGYFPEIEFALSTGPVAIDSWVVR